MLLFAYLINYVRKRWVSYNLDLVSGIFPDKIMSASGTVLRVFKSMSKYDEAGGK